jgi:hypothetical protein
MHYEAFLEIQRARLSQRLTAIQQRASARRPGPLPEPTLVSRKRPRAITEVDLAYLEAAEDDDDEFSE